MDTSGGRRSYTPAAAVELDIGRRFVENVSNVIASSRLLAAAATVLLCIPSSSAYAERVTEAEYRSIVDNLLSAMGPGSLHAAIDIRETYRPYVDLLALKDFDHIESGLATGGLVPLPLDTSRFNVRVRLDGTSPIAEKDLEHQVSYVSARAATIGCLLDVASRVKSGPVEVTSLVRHLDYQNALRSTNPNAMTEVPTHALGLAFDIAVVNTQIDTVREIADVLREMSEAGDVMVIAERQQLVFHVVPQPARLGWYEGVYARAITGQQWPHSVTTREMTLNPHVTTAIASIDPLPSWAAEWWAADNAPVDVPFSVRVTAALAGDADPDAGRTPITGRYLSVFGGLLSTTWRFLLNVA